LNRSSGYLHVLDGRIRVKISEVKRSPRHAEAIERRFRDVEGIDQVVANPMTGNVLIVYNSDRIEQRRVFDLLMDCGWLPAAVNHGRSLLTGDIGVNIATSDLGREIAGKLATALMQAAVKKLVVGLI
jgi:hypothetical protein